MRSGDENEDTKIPFCKAQRLGRGVVFSAYFRSSNCFHYPFLEGQLPKLTNILVKGLKPPTSSIHFLVFVQVSNMLGLLDILNDLKWFAMSFQAVG